MSKTVGQKHLINILNDYSSQEAGTFSNKKEVYFDAMEFAIENIKTHLESADGQTIETLKERAQKLDKDIVNKVLEDVKLTIEFDID